MKKPLRFWLGVPALLVILAPICFIATFLLHPLWSWIEATFGVESIGHAAPADWCFFAVYGLFVIVSLPFLWIFFRRS